MAGAISFDRQMLFLDWDVQEEQPLASNPSSHGADMSGGLPLNNPAESSGHALAGWTGGFAPAPVDWELRTAFAKSKPDLQELIEVWRDGLDVDYLEVGIGACYKLSMSQHDRESWVAQNRENSRPFEYDVTNSSGLDCKQGDTPFARSTLKGEIAHKAWVPATISGDAADDWWTHHIMEPAIDADVPPFWKRFVSAHTLQSLQVPNARVDPSANDMPTVLRQTAVHSVKTYDPKKAKRATCKKKRLEKARLKAAIMAKLQLDNPNAPTVNCFLRPADRRDLPQIVKIYNHFVAKSVFCAEGETLTAQQMGARFVDITDARLPFLVAVDRSTKGTIQFGPQIGYGEHILGFALADDFNDRSGMYRYTVEVEIYVDPNYLRLGVARCLLDQMLIILDQGWDPRRGYDFFPQPAEALTYGPGGRRVVGSIIINAPYDSKDKSRITWMDAFLSGFGFEKVAELEEIGHKLSTVVNLALFMKKTGSKIEGWAL